MTNPNDPAFPNGPIRMANMEGLTKREYFAAIAINGVCNRHGSIMPQVIAKETVAIADALIAELNK